MVAQGCGQGPEVAVDRGCGAGAAFAVGAACGAFFACGGVSPCTPSSFEALMMGVYCGVVWRFLPCVFATVGVCVCHSEVGFCVWVWVDLLGVVCAWRV